MRKSMTLWNPGVVLMILAVSCGGGQKKVSVLPNSRSAVYIEDISPDTVRMKGIGEAGNYIDAIVDAKKAAAYQVALSLLSTQEEKQLFAQLEEKFFKGFKRYMVGPEVVLSKKKSPDRSKTVVQIRIDVSRKNIQEDLVNWGVVREMKQLAAEVGKPVLMVWPEKSIRKAKWMNAARNHVNSYLTSEGFEIKDAEAEQNLSELQTEAAGIAGADDDEAAALAAVIGADVYVKYEVILDEKGEGVKGTATVKAYETTTAALLGAHTAFSRTYPKTAGVEEKCVIESLSDAVAKVIQDVIKKWKEYVEEGQPYEVALTGDFQGPDGRKLQRGLYGLLKSICTSVKTETETEGTLKYSVHSKRDSEDFKNAFEESLEKLLEKLKGEATYKRVMASRKIMIYHIGEE
ncbi:MAG: hypothetical protein GXP49_07050 [Deltaproteobacteria bacterium]|nr:hypothetical protein [Deltaproteobacteria bacterium]